MSYPSNHHANNRHRMRGPAPPSQQVIWVPANFNQSVMQPRFTHSLALQMGYAPGIMGFQDGQFQMPRYPESHSRNGGFMSGHVQPYAIQQQTHNDMPPHISTPNHHTLSAAGQAAMVSYSGGPAVQHNGTPREIAGNEEEMKKVVFAGHSFIRRFERYLQQHPLKLPVSEITWCYKGGWKIPDLRSDLENLSDRTVFNSIIYLEIGTNDLCNKFCNPAKLAADVCRLAVDLLSRGAAFIIMGEPLHRYGPALVKYGGRTPCFTDAANELVRELHRLCQGLKHVKVWKHTKIAPPSSIYPITGGAVPDRFDDDGVHLKRCRSCPHCNCGMKRYLKSVWGALLHAISVMLHDQKG